MGVTGSSGGVFFRAREPESLGAWCAEHLGIGGGEMGSWDQDAPAAGRFARIVHPEGHQIELWEPD